ncbi:MAG TPA: HAMP domain-containing sensor histidine kinase [Casimicrobiaceae bacterium]
MLNNVSYRLKIPLSLSAVIVIAALVVALPLIVTANRAAKRDVIDNGLSLGRTLARTLQPSLLHDEMWQAYEILRIPFEADAPDVSGQRTAIVVDTRGMVYVSTDLRRFPATQPLAGKGPVYARLVDEIYRGNDPGPTVLEELDPSIFFMVVPILGDDQTRLGTLVLEFSRAIFTSRILQTIRNAAIATLLVLAFLLPLGWLWGRRIVAPLLGLSHAMAQVTRQPVSSVEFEPAPGKDEIATLGRRFAGMLAELKQKALLEREVLASERLAAVGRLTAGIAHEINNPLGGMLNAISTYRRHGSGDSVTEKTISLLERGLKQIKDTVGALLVEARLESRALTGQDIDDVRTLIKAELERNRIELTWHNQLDAPLPLPSTEVRQIAMNLLLNAIEAAGPRGRVRCVAEPGEASLKLTIDNDGKSLTPQQLEHLFEPFPASSKQGRGLGLWMTYQLVQRLRGRIDTKSEPGATRFSVLLPIEVAA